MQVIDDLSEMVLLLENAYETAKSRLEHEMPDANPLEVQTTDGRYVLLDSLTALVVAKTALREWKGS